MRNAYFYFLLVGFSAFAGWESPSVLCPEEILPRGLECPDLSSVKNPYTDFPAEFTAHDRNEWTYQHAADLKLCRHKEVLSRETRSPGTFTPTQIQIAWMIVNGGKNSSAKLRGIMAASQAHQIPPHVLLGALTQESLLANLGISADGGNYSCGIAQLNVQEWCGTVGWLPYAERERMGWPQINCSDLPTTIVEPFYKIAVTRLNGGPLYRLSTEDFDGITLDQVKTGFPPGTAYLQENRFKAVASFLKHCQDIDLAIQVKAKTLKNLFQTSVPEPLRKQQLYAVGETFGRSCQTPYPTKYYPLHTGWLLAVANYNAGPRETKLVEHYFKIKENKFPELSPLDLIEALHWGGKVKEGTNKVFFVGQEDRIYSQTWYKSCVVQRHVARVIQHVTIPGKTIAKSLEQVPCAQGAVPKYRRVSSGVKN